MEENIEKWHVDKMTKYQKLVCPGWKVHLMVLEVGCRGYVSSRVVSLLRKLGLTAPESKTLRDNLQLIARKCSYVIWINRFNKNFNPTLRILRMVCLLQRVAFLMFKLNQLFPKKSKIESLVIATLPS